METSHYQVFQVLILAKALQLRGADVRILLCDSVLPGCELKNVRNDGDADPCMRCRHNRNRLVPLLGLPVTTLSQVISGRQLNEIDRVAQDLAREYPERHVVRNVDIIPIVNDSVLRYFYGSGDGTNHEFQRVRREHIATALIGVTVAQQFSQDWDPDIVLNNMYVYSAWQPYFDYFKANTGVRGVTVSITPFNYQSVVLNAADLYTSSERFQRYVAQRERPVLSEAERAELLGFFANRRSGNAQVFKDLGFFHDGASDRLPREDMRRKIFLFPNVHWDVGMSASESIFSGVIDWVLQTASFLANYPDCDLYIKPHPAERFDSSPSRKGVADYVLELFGGNLPQNVHLILPEARISPYSLVERMDLAVVFNGTLGLELALEGVPTVSTGQVPYGDLGIVTEPKSWEDYVSLLVGRTAVAKPSKRETELFAYFYFIKACIPWRLTKRAYSDVFEGYMFESLDELLPGNDEILDHLCGWILNPQDLVLEAWSHIPTVGQPLGDPPA